MANYDKWIGPAAPFQRVSRGAFAVSLPLFSVTPTVVCANCVMGALLCALMSLAGTLLFALSWSALNPTKHLKKLLERPQRDVSA